jgi:hypothetical protein
LEKLVQNAVLKLSVIIISKRNSKNETHAIRLDYPKLMVNPKRSKRRKIRLSWRNTEKEEGKRKLQERIRRRNMDMMTKSNHSLMMR